MPTSNYSISHHHLADHLIYLSSSSSFWFSLYSSYEHDFHLSKRLGTSWPVGCRIASLRPLVVLPSCPAPTIALALALAVTLALALAPSIACRRRCSTQLRGM